MDKKIWVAGIITIAMILIIVGYFVFQKPSSNQVQTNNNVTANNFMIQNMKVEIAKEGSGQAAKTGDKVTVNYTGKLSNGTVFDSNIDPQFKHVEPYQLTLGQNSVIQGWELGVLGMKAGEKRTLTIPPELGYGAAGAGTIIPPNATLIFEVDLLKIN